jgi:hypothetical protein
MSTVDEIEAAIKALPPTERERLADNLPSILPELNGDLKWKRIIHDTQPRPALTALGDEIAAQVKSHSGELREIRNRLDDLIEDNLEFTPEFEAAVQESEREMAGGIRPRVRQP